MAKILLKFFTVSISCVLIGAVSSTVWAVVLPFRDLDQMIRDAPSIVRGQVIAKRSLWSAERRHIYTEIRLRVLESLKGQVENEIILRKLGGVLDGIASRVPGSETYRVGEEVILLLEERRVTGHYFVLGLASGKYEVLRQGQDLYLRRSLDGISFHRRLGQPTAPTPTVYHFQHSERPLSITELKQRIAYVENQSICPQPPQINFSTRPSCIPHTQPPIDNTTRSGVSTVHHSLGKIQTAPHKHQAPQAPIPPIRTIAAPSNASKLTQGINRSVREQPRIGHLLLSPQQERDLQRLQAQQTQSKKLSEQEKQRFGLPLKLAPRKLQPK